MLSENSIATVYQAIVKQDFDLARKYIKQGQEIPELLFKQVTNHDNIQICEFLLEEQPNKLQYLLKLSIAQGAINCLTFLVEKKNGAILEEFTHIIPRRNVESISSYLSKIKSSSQPVSEYTPPSINETHGNKR